jgi:hypothetical protein
MNDAGFDDVRGRGDSVPLCAPCCQMGKTAVNVWVLREQSVNDTPVVACSRRGLFEQHRMRSQHAQFNRRSFLVDAR